MAQVSEAAIVLVHSFGKLFDQAELDVQQWEGYPVPVHRRIFYGVPCSASPFSLMLSLVPTIPHAQKARVLGESGLLSQQKDHHLNHSC